MKQDIGLDAGLPMDTECEQLVLGAMMTAREAAQALSAELSAQDFALDKHQRIYSAIQRITERGNFPDRVLVIRELMSRSELESVDGASYLVSLDEGLPKIFDLDNYARRIREKAVLRRGVFQAQLLINRFCSPDATMSDVESAEHFYRDLSGEIGPERRLKRLGEFLRDEAGGLDGFLNPHRSQPAIATPWPNLSDLLGGGFHPGELIIIAGRPSHGKSAAAGQIASYAAGLGSPNGIFSLEMRASENWRRMLAASASVNLQTWRKGKLSAEERRRLMAALARIDEQPVWIDDSQSGTMGAIRKTVHSHRAAALQLDLLSIDYLQLMSAPGKHGSRAEELSTITRQMKLFARELGIPIVLLSMVKRYPGEEEKPPELWTLKDSGSIEQDADVVVFVWQQQKDRDECLKTKTPCPTLLYVAKQRNGPVGKVKVHFTKEYVRLDQELEADRDSGPVQEELV